MPEYAFQHEHENVRIVEVEEEEQGDEDFQEEIIIEQSRRNEHLTTPLSEPQNFDEDSLRILDDSSFNLANVFPTPRRRGRPRRRN